MRQILTPLALLLLSQLATAQTMETKHTLQSELTFQVADRDHFSGNAEFARLPLLPSHGEVMPAIVNFAANAVTDWHRHSTGQYLIVIAGTGRFQHWGQPQQIITKGDVVWIAPNIKHWHGAGEFTAMSHIAISPVQGNQVTWLEKVQPEKTPDDVNTNVILARSLSVTQLAIIPLTIAVTQGEQAAVTSAIVQGLKAGLTLSELTEIISHQFAYIGAPKILNAMLTLKSVVEERAKQGIADPQGRLATERGQLDYYELGTQKLAALTKRSTQSPLFDFAPAVDYAIKAQLFGYQFSRDNLGDVERELATVGSLLALGSSVNAQLRSHLRILTLLGLTEHSFNQLITMVDIQHADNLRTVWAQLDKQSAD